MYPKRAYGTSQLDEYDQVLETTVHFYSSMRYKLMHMGRVQPIVATSELRRGSLALTVRHNSETLEFLTFVIIQASRLKLESSLSIAYPSLLFVQLPSTNTNREYKQKWHQKSSKPKARHLSPEALPAWALLSLSCVRSLA